MKWEQRLTLTSDDGKRYLEHSVEVPPGTAALRVTLDFAPVVSGGVRNMLCLSLFEPGGFRGAGHRHRLETPHEVVLTERWATPGYLPGPLTPGCWTVEVDTHMVHGATGCVAELAVEALPAAVAPPGAPERGAAAAPPPSSAAADRRPRTASPGPRLPPLPPGWLRGDVHAHSRHSDARWDVEELVEGARALGLDFVALTDHNTVSGLPELGDSELVTLPGMELTTFHGHALALGLTGWTDWRTGRAGRTMADAAREVAERGGVFVIAHPMSAGDPRCTGCRWRYRDASPGPAHHVEIFNGGLDDGRNEQALGLWYDWLDRGREVYATAGTDAHHAGHMVAGKHFNVVRCARREPAALLAALAAGRSYLSSGPHLALTVSGGGGLRAGPGDTVAPGDAVVEAGWAAAEASATVRLLVNGEARAAWPADGEPDSGPGRRGAADAAAPAQDRRHAEGAPALSGEPGGPAAGAAAGRRRAHVTLAPADWCLLELRDAGGRLVAVTNPVRARP